MPALLCYHTGTVSSFHLLLIPSFDAFLVYPNIEVGGHNVFLRAQSDSSKRVAQETDSDNEREDDAGNSGDTE